jgi:uncharacterized protein
MSSSPIEKNRFPVKADSVEPIDCARGAARWGYLFLAGLFFVLGALGAVLPVLPTTPFLLLTSYFLARSSPKWQRVLLRSRWFGPILNDWQKHRGVKQRVKYQAVVMVLVVVSISCYFTAPAPPVLAAILTLASIGIGVVICLPVVKNVD